MLLRRLLAVSLLLLANVALVGCGPPYDARVVDPSGGRLPTRDQQGVEVVTGRSGDTYGLVLDNSTSKPVAALVAIDGLDLVTGVAVEDSGAGRTHRGAMILPPFTYTEVRGFWVGRTRSSSFRFTEPEQALATRKGDGSALGRIEVVFVPVVRVTPSPPSPPAEPGVSTAEPDDTGYVKTPPGPHAPDGIFGEVSENTVDGDVARAYQIVPNAVAIRRVVLTYATRAGAKLGTAGPPPSPIAAAPARAPTPPDDDDDVTSFSPSTRETKAVKVAKPTKAPKPSKPSKAPKPSSADK